MDKSAALTALSALGQETRLEVFRLLVRAGAAGLPAGEIAVRLGSVQNTMSAHLKIFSITPGWCGRRARAGSFATLPK